MKQVLALPLLATIFPSLSGGLSAAQEPSPIAAQRAPGQVREVIAPAATVLQTTHYQAELTLNCSNSYCNGFFPRPGAKRRFNITRMACHLAGPTGSPYWVGWLELRKADNSTLLRHVLPADYTASGTSRATTINQAVDLQVSGNQRIYVILYLTSGSTLSSFCTASGTQDTLQ
jgi:hypothetical protein